MYQIRNGNTVYLPVRFFDSTGVPITGITFNTVSATVLHSDGTSALVSPASGGPGNDWVEATFGDFLNSGVYLLKVTGSNLAVNGVVAYAVSTSVVGAKKHVGVVDIVAIQAAEIYNRIGAPTLATVSADIAAINTQSASILTRLGAPAGASIAADIAGNLSAISSLSTKVGTPAGASVSADLASVKTDTSSTLSRLGAPTGASVSADIAGIQTKLGTPAHGSVSADIAAIDFTSVLTAISTLSTKVGTPAGASIAADIAQVYSALSSISVDLTPVLTAIATLDTKVQVLKDVALGKWEIKASGPDANRLIIYKPDGVTIIQKFDLQNSNGDGTFINPFKRIPTP